MNTSMDHRPGPSAWRRTLLSTAILPFLALSACASGGAAEPLDDIARASAPLPTSEPPMPIAPEVPVGASVAGPATGSQDHAEAAYNGSLTLVVWQDERAAPEPAGLWAARVGPDGAPLDAFNLELTPAGAAASPPAVATDGDGFLVVFQGEAPGLPLGVHALRLNAAGAVLGTSTITTSPDARAPYGVAFDGVSYVAVWPEGPWGADSALYRARISPQGAVLDPGGVLTAQDAGGADIAFDGTSSVITWTASQGEQILAARVSPAGALLDPGGFPLGPAEPLQHSPAVGCHAGQCTVAWVRPDPAGNLEEQLVTARVSAGAVLDPQPAVVASAAYIERIQVVADAAGALLAWDHNEANDMWPRALRAARVDPAGALLDPGGVALAARGARPAAASAGAHRLVAWSDQTHDGDFHGEPSIVGLRLDAGGAPLDAAALPISVGQNAQSEPSLTFDGGRFILAWRDDRGYAAGQTWDLRAARLSIGGAVLDVDDHLLAGGAPWQRLPRVTSDGALTLAAWWACDTLYTEAHCRLRAARLSPSGGALDDPPLDAGLAMYPGGIAVPPASAGGGAALIGGSDDAGPFGVVAVSAAGQISPPARINALTATASAFDGASHLFVWALPSTAGGASPVLGARLSPDGTLLDTADGFAIAPPGGDARAAAVAFDGANHVVVWHDAAGGGSRLYAARVSPAGAVLDAQPVLVADLGACLDVGLGPGSIAFDGDRTLVAWRACGPAGTELQGAALDASLGGTIFTLVADPRLRGAPALASAGEGTTLLAYSSYRAEAPSSAPRLFTRRLGGRACAVDADCPSGECVDGYCCGGDNGGDECTAGAGGGGGTGGGGGIGGAAGDPPADDPGDIEIGCGCAAPGAPPARGGALLVIAMAAAAAALRRRAWASHAPPR